MLVISEITAEFLQSGYKAFGLQKPSGKAAVKRVISVRREWAYLPVYQSLGVLQNVFHCNLDAVPGYFGSSPRTFIIWVSNSARDRRGLQLGHFCWSAGVGLTGCFVTPSFIPSFLWNPLSVWVQRGRSELLIPPWATFLAAKEGVRM